MEIHTWVWLVTGAVLLAVLAIDILIIARRPHEPSLKESALAVTFYVSLALLFGLGILVFSGGTYAVEFYAGWVTEYSLSIDNLFVFIIIMSQFAVPRQYQQTALLIGIILAIVMRGIFIALGAAAIASLSWIFYIFGLFLLFTAIRMVIDHNKDDDDDRENIMVRLAKKYLPATDHYNGVKLLSKENGKRLLTPMALVVVALGSADLMFALDSIPAIFGLTKEPYLVFTANVFALMGLRQLYFLIGGLLQRLVYLSHGLSVVLAFIGVKLILHAIHENNLPFLNGGEPIHAVPEIGIGFSIGFIFVTLMVTTIASLISTRNSKPDASVDQDTNRPT